MKIDHILLMGHGGPCCPEEVMPFLKTIATEKSISGERLQEKASQYEAIGGVSPYQEEIAQFATGLERSLQKAGISIPVFFGMKYWHPFFSEVLTEIYKTGLRRGLGIALNAFPGAVSGARYRESLEKNREALSLSSLRYEFLNGWYDQPLFIEAHAERITSLFEGIPQKERQDTALIFSFHSLPAKTKGTCPGTSYSEEANTAGELVARVLGHDKWFVAYQSAPAAIQEPWLGPDIGEVISELARKGERRLIIVPLGFLCDHVEIIYDLDHKARETAARSGMEYLRAGTVMNHPKITRLWVNLIADKIKTISRED